MQDIGTAIQFPILSETRASIVRTSKNFHFCANGKACHAVFYQQNIFLSFCIQYYVISIVKPLPRGINL